MTNAELIEQLMSRLGQRRSTRVREDLVTEVTSAIEDLEVEPFVPWFLESTATLAFSEGLTFVDLPADFSIERESTRPYYVLEGTTYYLTKMVSGAIFGYTTSNTAPQRYSIIGNEIHIRPVADQDYTIYLPYYAKTNASGFDDNANQISNVWLLEAKEWVANKALAIVAGQHLQNERLEAKFLALEMRHKRQIYSKHIAREAQNQDYQVGGASDGT
jgi:hypothetical protein